MKKMKNILRKFKKQLDEIEEKKYEGLIKKGYIDAYHYTSWDGMIGILSSKKIWLTHHKFLHDTTEIKIGLDRAKKEISNSELPNYVSEEMIDALERADYYILSLSEEKNNSTLWDRYSKRGTGCCCRIRIKMFGKDKKATSIIQRILYSHRGNKTNATGNIMKKHAQLLRGFLEKLDKVRKKNSDEIKKIRQEGEIYHLSYISSYVPMIKHDFFRDEKELRLVMPAMKLFPNKEIKKMIPTKKLPGKNPPNEL